MRAPALQSHHLTCLLGRIDFLLVVVLLMLGGLSWSDLDEWREDFVVQDRGVDCCRSRSAWIETVGGGRAAWQLTSLSFEVAPFEGFAAELEDRLMFARLELFALGGGLEGAVELGFATLSL